MTVDPKLEELLIESGWARDRKVDRSYLQQLISKEGYEVLPKVLDFLESFNGITIQYTNLRNGKPDDITLDFSKGDDLESRERIVEDYEARIHKKLCVIGTASRKHLVLVMDEDGGVYGGYSDFLMKIGDSGMGAIEAIVYNNYNKEYEEIK